MPTFRILLILVVFVVGPAFGQGGLGGGGPIEGGRHGVSCIPAAELAALRARLAGLQLAVPGEDGVALPRPYPVYPIAGGYDQDLFTGNFVDLDATALVRDWNCGAYSYDGHGGIDSGLRTFDEQLIGVPVFAADDGVVVATDDGHPDMNTNWANLPANYVVVAHPGQRTAYYWHLKNGSVAVAPGQTVKAGQELGLMGSSGVSGGPHLHFETWDQNVTTLVEPFAGSCRPGRSEWVEQPPAPGALYLSDFGLSRTQPGQGPPFAVARDPRYVTTDPVRYYWMTLHHLPPNTAWRVRWLRPNGTVAMDAGPASFGNSTPWQWAWFWFQWWVPDMDTTPGTWTLLLDFNGVTALAAPVVVALPGAPFLNRPPEPIAAVITPNEPGAGEALVCRVQNDWVKDDLDWDIVRFRYVWRRNGAIVRQLTSAARTDTLPHHVANFGDLVTCTVTPNDGTVDGASAIATTAIVALSSPSASLPLAAGSLTEFALDTGVATAGAAYGVVASLAGSAPGTPLVPGVTLALNLDALSTWMIQFPNSPPWSGNFGTLDATGQARLGLALPPGLPPALAGLSLTHAGVVFGTPWIATNALPLLLVP